MMLIQRACLTWSESNPISHPYGDNGLSRKNLAFPLICDFLGCFARFWIWASLYARLGASLTHWFLTRKTLYFLNRSFTRYCVKTHVFTYSYADFQERCRLYSEFLTVIWGKRPTMKYISQAANPYLEMMPAWIHRLLSWFLISIYREGSIQLSLGIGIRTPNTTCLWSHTNAVQNNTLQVLSKY